jgi:hypothetical protein
MRRPAARGRREHRNAASLGRPVAQQHELLMLALGLASKREITRIRIPVRSAMAAQAREQGGYLGGRPPYGYRLAQRRFPVRAGTAALTARLPGGITLRSGIGKGYRARHSSERSRPSDSNGGPCAKRLARSWRLAGEAAGAGFGSAGFGRLCPWCQRGRARQASRCRLTRTMSMRPGWACSSAAWASSGNDSDTLHMLPAPWHHDGVSAGRGVSWPVRPVVPRIGPTTGSGARGRIRHPGPHVAGPGGASRPSCRSCGPLLRAEYQQVSALIYLRCTCGGVPAKDVDGALLAALSNVRGAA